MKAPAFWSLPRPDLRARLLQPAGALYGAATLWRMRRARMDCGIPVICVGNYTVGGGGKTPVAIYVAQLLATRGMRVFFLSRGYGGTLARVGAPLRIDAAMHTARQAGDEPLLLGRVAPVIVAADRVAGARLAIGQGATVIVMDDGLQGSGLRHTLALGVIDAAAGFGNGLCLPAGPLRAPVAGQRAHIGAELVIGEGAALPPVRLPRFTASLRPDPAAAAKLKGRRVLAFAGIGRPEKFFTTLAQAGADIVQRRGFADHHVFSASELAALGDAARRDALLPVTTEKDAVRLPAAWLAQSGACVLPVTLQVESDAAFAELVMAAIGRG